jgi:hypothetical protein
MHGESLLRSSVAYPQSGWSPNALSHPQLFPRLCTDQGGGLPTLRLPWLHQKVVVKHEKN